MKHQTGSLKSRCRYCGVVNRVCYGGPQRQAAWKRPLLVIISTLITVGVASFFFLAYDRPGVLFLYLFGTPLLAMSVMGLLVGIKGCEACVARLMYPNI